MSYILKCFVVLLLLQMDVEGKGGGRGGGRGRGSYGAGGGVGHIDTWAIILIVVAVLVVIIFCCYLCFCVEDEDEENTPVLKTPEPVVATNSEMQQPTYQSTEAQLEYPDNQSAPTGFISTPFTVPTSSGSGYPSCAPPDYASALFDPDHPDISAPGNATAYPGTTQYPLSPYPSNPLPCPN